MSCRQVAQIEAETTERNNAAGGGEPKEHVPKVCRTTAQLNMRRHSRFPGLL